MGKKTSVDLSDFAAETVKQWQGTYGLKNILSAGVVAFGSFPPDLQVMLIAVANDTYTGPGHIEEIFDFARESVSHPSPVSVERAVMGMKNAIQIYPRLPASDKKLVDDFLGGLDVIRQAGGVPAKATGRDKSPKQSKSQRGSAKGA